MTREHLISTGDAARLLGLKSQKGVRDLLARGAIRGYEIKEPGWRRARFVVVRASIDEYLARYATPIVPAQVSQVPRIDASIRATVATQNGVGVQPFVVGGGAVAGGASRARGLAPTGPRASRKQEEES